MADNVYLPRLLITIPRNPVTAVGLPLAIGFARGVIIREGVKHDWFSKLCTPPGHISHDTFSVAWPVFYLSLGYASHLAAKAVDLSASAEDVRDVSIGLAVYYLHLGLNLAWPPLFFKAKRNGLAFANTAFMAVTAFYMTKLWDRPTNHEATFCLLPYCAWMAYVTYLNGGVWWLNISRRGSKIEDEDEDEI